MQLRSILLTLALIAAFLPAVAESPGTVRVEINSPHHAGGTIKIVLRGCDSGIVRVDGSLIVALPIYVPLDESGHGETLLYSNDRLYCDPTPGLKRRFTTSYTAQIVNAGKPAKENTFKARTGKAIKVKL